MYNRGISYLFIIYFSLIDAVKVLSLYLRLLKLLWQGYRNREQMNSIGLLYN